MQGYPIVHTRTFFNDFYFCVKPDFVDSDVVSPYLLAATNSLISGGSPSDIRMIYSCDRYSIVGIACYSSHFLSGDELENEYCKDEFGRKVYGFWGVAILKESYDSIPVFDEECCKIIFRQYICPIWKERSLTALSCVEPIELVTEAFSDFQPESHGIIENTNYLFFNDKNYQWALYQALHSNKELSYCSFLNGKDSQFTYADIDTTVYQRIKKEYEEFKNEKAAFAAFKQEVQSKPQKQCMLKKLFRRNK